MRERHPDGGVAQINGSMSLSEKRTNIDTFNDTAQFMVSTEAGGEGINLHDRCHILVNYDLPWNPSRLVQRAGRLYRYGQQKRVIVFNLTAEDGFDNKTLSMMLDRVESIAQDMAEVDDDYRDGLETEIIGDLLERLDIASILSANRSMDVSRTDAEIDAAIERAREAKRQQENLFAHVEGYNPQASTALYTFGPEDVLAFLEGILQFKGVAIRTRLHSGRTLEIQLPEELRGRYSEFPPRATVVRVTVDRRIATRRQNVVPMDFASPFFRDLVDFAKSPEFKGEYTRILGPESGTLTLYKIRWQNDQGVPRWETLIPVFLSDSAKGAISNPGFFGNLLRSQAIESDLPISDNLDIRRKKLKLTEVQANSELSVRCSTLRHPNDVVLIAGADIIAAECPPALSYAIAPCCRFRMCSSILVT